MVQSFVLCSLMVSASTQKPHCLLLWIVGSGSEELDEEEFETSRILSLRLGGFGGEELDEEEVEDSRILCLCLGGFLVLNPSSEETDDSGYFLLFFLFFLFFCLISVESSMFSTSVSKAFSSMLT